jgi:phage-related protein
MATIRDLQVKLTVDADVEKGVTKTTYAFKEIVKEAEQTQRKLDDVGNNSTKTDSAFSRLGSTSHFLSGHLGSLGGQLGGMASGMVSMGAKAGLAGAALGSFALAGISAVSSTASLLAALAPAVGIVAALPGAIAGGVAIMGTLKLALVGVGDAFKAALSGNPEKFAKAIEKLSPAARAVATELRDAAPQFHAFQQAAQDAFFQPLVGSIQAFATALQPLGPYVKTLAGEMGNWAKEFVTFGSSTKTINQLSDILGTVRLSLRSLRSDIQPIAAGFLNLASVGATFIGTLVPGIADAGVKFGAWLTKISESGQAMQWMNNALLVFKQLGAIAKDLGGILNGVFKAMSAAGSGALGIIGQVLDGMNKWVNSTEGANALVSVFTTLRAIGQAFIPVLTAVLTVIGKVAPAIGKLAEIMGPVLLTVVKSLGDGLQAMIPGFLQFVSAFGQGIQSLAPALKPLGAALGQVFSNLSVFFTAFGPAIAALMPGIAAFLGALSRGIAALAPALKPLGEAFSGILVAVSPLLPIIGNLAAVFAQSLAAGIKLATPGLIILVNGLGGLLQAVMPLIPVIINLGFAILNDLMKAIGPLLPVVGQLVNVVGQFLVNALGLFLKAIEPLLPAISQMFQLIGTRLVKSLIDISPPLLNVIAQWVQLLPALLPLLPVLTQLAVQILPVLTNVLKIGTQQGGEMAKMVVEIFKAVIPLVPKIGELLIKLLPLALKFTEIALALSEKLLPVAERMIPIVADVVTKVVGAFLMLWDRLVGHSIIPDIVNGITEWFRKLVQWVGDIIRWFANVPGMMADWFGRARDAAIGKFNELVNWVRGLPNAIMGALGNTGAMLYNSGRNIIQGLINGLWSMFNNVMRTVGDILGRIRSAFPFSPAKWGPFSGKGYTTYSGVALMQDFAKGIRSQSGIVDKAMEATMTSTFQPTAPALAIGGVAPVGQTTWNAQASNAAMVGNGSNSGGVVIQNLNLTFADDRDMYQKGQDFAAGLREYKRRGGVLPA